MEGQKRANLLGESVLLKELPGRLIQYFHLLLIDQYLIIESHIATQVVF